MESYIPLVLDGVTGRPKQLPSNARIPASAFEISGTASINFGAWPGAYEAHVVVPSDDVLSHSKVLVSVDADSATSDHTASDHIWLPALCSFTVGGIIEATAFVIYARSIERLNGTFLLQYRFNI